MCVSHFLANRFSKGISTNQNLKIGVVVLERSQDVYSLSPNASYVSAITLTAKSTFKQYSQIMKNVKTSLRSPGDLNLGFEHVERF